MPLASRVPTPFQDVAGPARILHTQQERALVLQCDGGVCEAGFVPERMPASFLHPKSEPSM